jgi:hypothetical protein
VLEQSLIPLLLNILTGRKPIDSLYKYKRKEIAILNPIILLMFSIHLILKFVLH